MKYSPLIYSVTIIASLALVTSGPALSNSSSTAKTKATTSAKAKTAQPRIAPAKTKSEQAISVPETVKLIKSDSLNIASTPTPTLAAKAINPYLANSGISFAPTVSAQANVTPASMMPPAMAAAVPTLSAVPAIAAVTIKPSTAAAGEMQTAQVELQTSAAQAIQPVLAVAPTLAAQPAAKPIQTASTSNPYLAYQRQTSPVQAYQPTQPAQPARSFNQMSNDFKLSMLSMPSMPSLPQFGNSAAQPMSAPTQSSLTNSANNLLSSLSFSNLKMMLPLTGESNILPSIKKVYPTGEKPLVVINFKCPTELVGITPPPIMLLREALDLGFSGLNKSNMLSFNLQQVCS
jgi:hypothetical protein